MCWGTCGKIRRVGLVLIVCEINVNFYVQILETFFVYIYNCVQKARKNIKNVITAIISSKPRITLTGRRDVGRGQKTNAVVTAFVYATGHGLATVAFVSVCVCGFGEF